MGTLLAAFLFLFVLVVAFVLVIAVPVGLLAVSPQLQDFVFSQPFLLEAYLTICFWPFCGVRRVVLRWAGRCCGASSQQFLYIACQPAGPPVRAHLLAAADLPPVPDSGLVVRCVVVSDTHGLQDDLPPLPKADVLIICGSLLLHHRNVDTQVVAQLSALDRWLVSSAIPERVVVAGCHDAACEELGPEKVQQLLPNAVYLQDETRTLQCGLLIYGSPRSLRQSEYDINGAFQPAAALEDLPEGALKAIPEGLDLLITHGPPAGTTSECVGSKRLLQIVKELRPTAHVYGHAREAFGAKSLNAGKLATETAVVFANCTSTDNRYSVVNPPIVLDVPIQRID